MAILQPVSRQRWQVLTELLDRIGRQGIESLSTAEVRDLCRLYRQVTIDLSRARANREDPELLQYLNHLSARAHGQVYRSRRISLKPLGAFLLVGFPRLFRKHGLAMALAAAVFIFSSAVSFFAVARDPELAYSLYDEHVVEYENLRLEKQQGEYRGNFTFDLQQSPFVAVVIIGNNIRVAVLAFAAGALFCLPGILLLVFNGRMLGTLTGMVWNHGYALAFYSLILTHGILELSAICIAGGSGLLLGWALVAPGRLTRQEALRRSAGDAFGLLAGSAVLLVIAGHLEAYVTPHAPTAVRWSVAVVSGILLFAYLALAGKASIGKATSE